MKKFYLFLVALVVSAFAANAVGPEKLYIHGSISGSGWDGEARRAIEMPKESDGVFTYTLNVNEDTWFKFNANWQNQEYYIIGPNDTDNDVNLVDNKEYKLINNKEKSFKASSGTYNLRVEFTSDSDIKLIVGQPQEIVDPIDPEEKEYTIYFYNNTSDAKWDAPYGNVWNGNGGIAGSPKLAGVALDKKYLKDSKYYTVWSYTFTSTAVPTNANFNAKDTNTSDGSNWTSEQSFVNGALYSNSGKVDDTPEFVEEVIVPTTNKYAIFGQIFGAQNWAPTALTDAGNGIWKYENANINTGSFGIRVYTENINTQTGWYAGVNGKNNITAPGTFAVTNNSQQDFNSSLVGNYNITLDVINWTITFEKVGGEDPEEKEYTIYFINKSAAGWENGKAHFWGNGVNETYPLVAANVKYNDNGTIYDVVKCSFKATNTPQYIQFTYNGKWAPEGSGYEFKNGAIYCTGGVVKEEGQYEWYEEAEPETASIYFNLGAAYLNDENVWGTADNRPDVFAYFHKKNSTEWTSGMKMTLSYAGSYIFGVEVEGIDQYDAVKFGNGRGKEYIVDENQWAFERENWAKYIYSIHTDNNVNYAIQSYVTFEQYDAVRKQLAAGQLSAVYVTGYSNGWSLDNDNLIKMEKNLIDGIYYREVTVGAPDKDGNRKFKMTWLNPNDYVTASVDDQRKWATFDLGIIGPDENENKIERPEGTTPYCTYEVRVPIVYNFYNNYDWEFKGNDTDVFHQIIDPSNGTTVLLTFDPNPTMDDFGVKLDKPTAEGYLDDYEIEGLGKYLLGAEYSGDARIRRVNQANGTATITPAKNRPSNFDELYSIKYYIIFNGVAVAELSYEDIKDYENAQGQFVIPFEGMAPGQNDIIGFNAEYTYNANGLKFHSHTTQVEYEGDIDYPDLGNLTIEKCAVRPARKENDEWVWDAMVKVVFEKEYIEGAALFYPVCDVTNEAGEHGYIADDQNDYWTSEKRRNDYNAWGNYVPHTKYVEGDYVHATHNWSIKARDERAFHVYVPAVARTETNKATNMVVRFNMEAYASYPFLIQKIGDTFAAHRGVAALADEAPKAPMTFHIVNSGDKYVLSTENVTIGTSGVNDIELGESEGEFELYNLQGVRVEGEAAPGLYIRRQGNKAEKIYIR